MVDQPKAPKKETVNVPTLGNSNKPLARWWNIEEEDALGAAAWQSAQNIILFQQARQMDYFNYATMYGSRGLGYSNTSISTGPSTISKSQRDVRLRLNAAKANVDAAQAKIAKNRPRPMFLTTGGDWAQEMKAKKLTQYLDGAFDMANTYDEAANVFRNACIFGTGAMKVYPDVNSGKICTESVWIEELVVDEAEAQYGTPRQMHQTRLIHREVLYSLYGTDEAKRDMIAGAASSVYTSSDTRDMIQVTESWHLASAPGAKDGINVVSIKEGTLSKRVYDKNYFPFVFFRWQPGLRSFFGTGIIENLFNIQLEINQTCATIQQAIYFAAVPRVYLSNSSKIVSQHIDNRVGSIVRFSDSKGPQFDTPTANNPEMYSYLQYLWEKSFESTGLSEQSATSTKPSGLDAAVAMREFQDIETQRFAIVGQAWEQFFMDLAKVFVDLSKDMYEGNEAAGIKANKKLKVRAKKSKFIESIRWAEVNLPEDEYILRCFPTSLLPTQPAGRLQFVQELIQAGFIDKEMGMNLLDYPDLERVMSLKNAAADNALQILERIVDEGKYDTPEPYMNLDICIELGQGMYLKARNNNVGADRQELLRRFIDDCMALKKTPEQEAVATQQVAAQPLAAPMPAPTSELVPNIVPPAV